MPGLGGLAGPGREGGVRELSEERFLVAGADAVGAPFDEGFAFSGSGKRENEFWLSNE